MLFNNTVPNFRKKKVSFSPRHEFFLTTKDIFKNVALHTPASTLGNLLIQRCASMRLGKCRHQEMIAEGDRVSYYVEVTDVGKFEITVKM